MTDHWKDVERAQCDLDDYACGWQEPAMRMAVDALNFAVDAARAKDAEAHAAALAAKDAEIADLTTRLRWFTAYPCHWTKVEIEYRTDCGQIVFPVSATPDGQCGGCGRPIVVS